MFWKYSYQKRQKLETKVVPPKTEHLVTFIMTLIQTDMESEISPQFLSSTHPLIIYRYQPLTGNWVIQELLRNKGRCSGYGRHCLVTRSPLVLE